MQGQQIRTMTFIALGLGFLVLLVERPWSRGEPGGGKLLYPDFHPEKIERIEVINRQDTVNLIKKDPIWLIQGTYPVPADTGTIRRGLEAVEKFETNQLASKNMSKSGVFQVDSTGANVKLFASGNKVAAEFLLGKTTPEGGTYFRPSGKDEVYSSPDRVRSLFVRNARAWQDRKIFDMEPGEASRLIVEHGDSTIVFEKNTEGKWFLVRPDSFPVKQEEMDQLLRTACKLVANALPDSAVSLAQAGLAGKPMLHVNVQRLDGSGVDMKIGGQDANGLFYLKPSDREWLYLIGKYRVDPFYKDLAALKAEPAGSPASAPADTIPIGRVHGPGRAGGGAPGTASPGGHVRRQK